VFGIPDAEHARIQADIKAKRLVCPLAVSQWKCAGADGALLAKGGKLQFSEPLVNRPPAPCARRPSCPTST
jgi:hypothetical protein